mgnify:CR=1 FL=1
MSAYISILGMYNYDPEILNGLRSKLPSYDKRLSPYDNMLKLPDPEFNTLRDNLLMECAELEIIYSNPDMLKLAISVWGEKMSRQWQELYDTTCYKYNAIWNKDGVIKRTETETRDITKNNIGNSTETSENTSNEENSANSNINETRTPNLTQTTTHDVAGFNSSTLTPAYKDTVNSTGTETTITNNNGSGKSKITDNGNRTVKGSSDDTEKGTITREYTDSESGNIGVTMTQQMITAQRDIILNIYDVIISDFKNRFCLLVY